MGYFSFITSFIELKVDIGLMNRILIRSVIDLGYFFVGF